MADFNPVAAGATPVEEQPFDPIAAGAQPLEGFDPVKDGAVEVGAANAAPQPWAKFSASPEFSGSDNDGKLNLLKGWTQAAAGYAAANGDKWSDVESKLNTFGNAQAASIDPSARINFADVARSALPPEAKLALARNEQLNAQHAYDLASGPGALSNFFRNIVGSASSAVLSHAAGVARITGATDVADQAHEASQQALGYYGANDARADDTSAHIARGLGAGLELIGETAATGGLGKIASIAIPTLSAAAGSYDDAFKKAMADQPPGADPAAATHAARIAAIKTIPEMVVYILANRLTAGATAPLLKEASPFVKTLAASAGATIANMAAGTANKAVDALIEKHSVNLDDIKPSWQSFAQDAAFGLHGGIEAGHAQAVGERNASDLLKGVSTDALKSAASDPEFGKSLPYPQRLVAAELAARDAARPASESLDSAHLSSIVTDPALMGASPRDVALAREVLNARAERVAPLVDAAQNAAGVAPAAADAAMREALAELHRPSVPSVVAPSGVAVEEAKPVEPIAPFVPPEAKEEAPPAKVEEPPVEEPPVAPKVEEPAAPAKLAKYQYLKDAVSSGIIPHEEATSRLTKAGLTPDEISTVIGQPEDHAAQRSMIEREAEQRRVEIEQERARKAEALRIESERTAEQQRIAQEQEVEKQRQEQARKDEEARIEKERDDKLQGLVALPADEFTAAIKGESADNVARLAAIAPQHKAAIKAELFARQDASNVSEKSTGVKSYTLTPEQHALVEKYANPLLRQWEALAAQRGLTDYDGNLASRIQEAIQYSASRFNEEMQKKPDNFPAYASGILELRIRMKPSAHGRATSLSAVRLDADNPETGRSGYDVFSDAYADAGTQASEDSTRHSVEGEPEPLGSGDQGHKAAVEYAKDALIERAKASSDPVYKEAVFRKLRGLGHTLEPEELGLPKKNYTKPKVSVAEAKAALDNELRADYEKHYAENNRPETSSDREHDQGQLDSAEEGTPGERSETGQRSEVDDAGASGPIPRNSAPPPRVEQSGLAGIPGGESPQQADRGTGSGGGEQSTDGLKTEAQDRLDGLLEDGTLTGEEHAGFSKYLAAAKDEETVEDILNSAGAYDAPIFGAARIVPEKKPLGELLNELTDKLERENAERENPPGSKYGSLRAGKYWDDDYGGYDPKLPTIKVAGVSVDARFEQLSGKERTAVWRMAQALSDQFRSNIKILFDDVGAGDGAGAAWADPAIAGFDTVSVNPRELAELVDNQIDFAGGNIDAGRLFIKRAAFEEAAHLATFRQMQKDLERKLGRTAEHEEISDYIYGKLASIGKAMTPGQKAWVDENYSGLDDDMRAAEYLRMLVQLGRQISGDKSGGLTELSAHELSLTPSEAQSWLRMIWEKMKAMLRIKPDPKLKPMVDGIDKILRAMSEGDVAGQAVREATKTRPADYGPVTHAVFGASTHPRALSERVTKDRPELGIAPQVVESRPLEQTGKEADKYFADQGGYDKGTDLLLSGQRGLASADTRAIAYNDAFNHFDAERKAAVAANDPVKAEQARKRMEDILFAGDHEASQHGLGLRATQVWTPEKAASDYVRDLTKDQTKKLSTKPEVATVQKALETARDQAAESTVTKALPALEKVEAITREAAAKEAGISADEAANAQSVFDFWEQTKKADVADAEKVKAAASQTVSKQVMLALGMADERVVTSGSQAERVRQEVNRQVAEQMRSLLPDGGAKPSGPDQIAKIISAVDTADLAEEAFKATVAKLQGELGNGAFDGAVFDRAKIAGLERFIKDRANLRDLARKSLLERNASMESIKQTLLDATKGLTHAQSETLAKALELNFNDAVRASAEKQLEALAKVKATKDLVTKDRATRLIELSNLGAFSQEKYYNAIADKYDLPVYKQDVADEIKRQADDIQTMLNDGKKGFQTNTAMKNLLTYVDREKNGQGVGRWTSLFYNNLMSGITTPVKVSLGMTVNTLADIGALQAATSLSPFAVARTLGAYVRGIAGKGVVEAAHILKTGYGAERPGYDSLNAPTRGLENDPFRGPVGFLANKMKYATRLIQGIDVAFFRGAQDARAQMMADAQVKQEGLTGAAAAHKVAQILEGGGGDVAKFKVDAEAKATAEGLTGLAKKMRVAELVEQARPADINADSYDFAGQAILHYQPKGFAGDLARSVQRMSEKYPIIKTVVPFTNIAANVLNAAIDVTPVGLLRAGLIGDGWEGRNSGDKRTAQIIKATAGTAALTALYLLNRDEDKSKLGIPGFRIHGAGPADMALKQQMTARGWSPYTVETPAGFFTYRDNPLSVGLSIVGNVLDGERYQDADSKDLMTRAAFAIGQSGKVILSNSFMAGVSDLIKALDSDNVNGGSKGVSNFLSRTASSIFLPNAVKQIERAFNPTVYKPDGLAQIMMRDFPVARTELKPAINALGEPVKRGVFSMFMTNHTDDPVWQWLGTSGLKIDVPNSSKIGDRNMTADELYQLNKETGERVKNFLSKQDVRDRIGGIKDADTRQSVFDQIVRAFQGAAKARVRAEAAKAGTLFNA